jgi:glycosyltransferase involved in cell wall biosynthesis
MANIRLLVAAPKNTWLHSRIFYKECKSIEHRCSEIHFWGKKQYRQSIIPEEQQYFFHHSHSCFALTSLFNNIHLLLLCWKYSPHILHLHHPSILPAALLYRFLSRCRVIYDVHEDYQANIIHSYSNSRRLWKFFPGLFRRGERLLAQRCNAVIYAETCYHNHLHIEKTKHYYVRNTFSASLISVQETPLANATPVSTMPIMLYCGTIAHIWGIENAIQLWKALNQYRPIVLQVVGFAYDHKLLDRCLTTIEASPWPERFQLVGGTEYVDYQTVLGYMQNCTFGLGLYEINPAIADKIPTKFYDWIGLQKPIVFSANDYWNSLNDQYNFGTALESPYESGQIEKLLEQIQQGFPTFYSNPIPVSFYSWELDAQELVRCYESLIHSG